MALSITVDSAGKALSSRPAAKSTTVNFKPTKKQKYGGKPVKQAYANMYLSTINLAYPATMYMYLNCVLILFVFILFLTHSDY